MNDFFIDGLTVKEMLLKLAENGNQKFSASLHPGIEHVLGIRIPDLRKLAARIAKGDWERYLSAADTYYMEERMLQGMVLGCIKPDTDVERYLARVTDFVWNINSWSVCDTFKFAGGKAFTEKNKVRLWEYLKHWMHVGEEYQIRFGVVMAMELFVDEEHLEKLLAEYDAIRHDGYYVKMGVAWALSVCFVKFPERTMEFLKSNRLDDETYNKTLQKIVESYRVDAETKNLIRSMKRKNN
ncbi:DNA alkylation repair protein [uncultured Bacteroides sp.]|uniref:DNA alkylation repair protein n=1 Tax=uncultured Bacteroides sp. TaxID=162156 RepID=UPI00262E59C7|nr:DNA alkylation repair protein [uncultured Bacteroides sp.]